jgi:hypothetical protein
MRPDPGQQAPDVPDGVPEQARGFTHGQRAFEELRENLSPLLFSRAQRHIVPVIVPG